MKQTPRHPTQPIRITTTPAHTTNEQMAEIMGWTLKKTANQLRWLDNGKWYGYTNFPTHHKYFNPIENLNHAALVEARLKELGLMHDYLNKLILSLVWDRTTPPVGTSDYRFLLWELCATASAQTRCDAAWATWQAWKEQQQ